MSPLKRAPWNAMGLLESLQGMESGVLDELRNGAAIADAVNGSPFQEPPSKYIAALEEALRLQFGLDAVGMAGWNLSYNRRPLGHNAAFAGSGEHQVGQGENV